MPDSAQTQTKLVFAKKKFQVLITDVGSYLGSQLAKSLLFENCTVYGICKDHPPTDLIPQDNFTLLEIDLSQPIPAYLPEFDLIFYIAPPQSPHISSVLPNIISHADSGRSKVFILGTISSGTALYPFLERKGNNRQGLSLLLFGDLYGPAMPLAETDSLGNNYPQHGFPPDNELANLISQAIQADKVILENEGLNMIYPTYITDAVYAINKFVFFKDHKNIHFISSQNPKTALTVAYEIQDAARLSVAKEVGLFFRGYGVHKEYIPEPVLEVAQEHFPKVHLSDGLRETFKYFESLGQLISSQTYQQDVPGKQPAFERWASSKPAAARHLTSRLPYFMFKPKIKKAILVFFIILFIASTKTLADVYLGVVNLKNAQTAAYKGNFSKAQKNAASSSKYFKTAASQVNILTSPLSLFWGRQTVSIGQSFESASLAAGSLAYFIKGAQALASDLAIITSKDNAKQSYDPQTAAANFNKAYFQSSQALQLSQKASQGLLLEQPIQKLQSALKDLNSLSLAAVELSNLIDDLIGRGGKKTYLVLLQNNAELRPGGGFIGNFGLVEFEDGKLKNISVEDIYTIDGQLKEKIEPPKQLVEKLAVAQFYLRDSNWAPDFEVNSSIARDFFKKETGNEVDGVIAIDLVFIQSLLAKIGPVKVSGYEEEITDKNLFERGEFYSEVGSFAGSTQKSDFFGSLTSSLIAKVIVSISSGLGASQQSEDNRLPWLALVEASRESLSQKHLMVTFDNPNLASFVKTKGWNHPLPPFGFNPKDDSFETRDLLSLSEANLGANKVNRFLERKIDYEMTIGRDADLIAKLKITYINHSQAETWPAGTYVNFLRVYVPFGAGPLEFNNGDQVDLNLLEVTHGDSLSTFSTFVEVPIKSSREVIIAYRIPKNIQLEKAPIYHLYVQKQPGTEKDPLKFTFNLPSYLTIKSLNDQDDYAGKQNIIIESDLSTDRQFEIEIVKK